MKNFYIASSLQNKEQVQTTAQFLIEHGFLHTYDWTRNNRATSFSELKTIGELERDGVKNADFIVLILPGGKGSHTELGMALALDKKVYIFSPDEDILDFSKTATFYHIKGVQLFIGELESFHMFLLKNTENLSKK